MSVVVRLSRAYPLRSLLLVLPRSHYVVTDLPDFGGDSEGAALFYGRAQSCVDDKNAIERDVKSSAGSVHQ